jgi:hypothetical protein
MLKTSIRRRLATWAAAAACTGGLLAITGGTAAAAPPQAQTPAAAVASTWVLSGIFPDPISCNIAGSFTGRPYYCSWSVFWFSLYVLV